MKIMAYAALALLLGAGGAFAADTNSGTSGRPGKILTDAQCQDAWIKAKGSRDALISPKEGHGIVINFQQADTNKDGKVTADEFKDACKSGFVQMDANDMKSNKPAD